MPDIDETKQQKSYEDDLVLASFLQFMENQMAAHPEDIVAADATQLGRIGELAKGVAL